MAEQTPHSFDDTSARAPIYVELEPFGEVITEPPGIFLGVPLHGAGDEEFMKAMAEIAAMEREARRITGNIRIR